MDFPIAIQLYCVRDEVAADFEGSLRRIKAMGYDGVEFAGLYGHTAPEIKAMCERVGLVPISAHVAMEQLAADPHLLADYAAIGCRYVVIPYLAEENRVGGCRYGETLKWMRQWGQEADALGLTLCYHNHDFEFAKVDGEYALDRLFRDVPAALMQTQQDTGWVAMAGEDPAAYLRKYAGRCPTIHLKDFRRPASDTPAYELCPVGEGLQDIPGILAAAAESGTRWIIVEQDDPSDGDTPMVCAEKSIRRLQTLLR